MADNESERHGGIMYWEKTISEIAKRKQVEEVILSGGDPLVYENEKLEGMLKDIRGIAHVKAIRIHTRAWTHNPFRIDKGFCALLKKYDVTEMGVHVIHPRELTDDFNDAIGRVRNSGAKTMLMCDTPLIKGINDDEKILHELFMGLYVAGVKPYYLSHNMPNIPFAGEQRTSVKKGLRIYNQLKRRISNPAMPEYIINHVTGKKTVPECEKGTPDFIYGKNKNGFPIIRFRNWKGVWQTYLDARD
jgi:lysine 2,3-aminomutase